MQTKKICEMYACSIYEPTGIFYHYASMLWYYAVSKYISVDIL